MDFFLFLTGIVLWVAFTVAAFGFWAESGTYPANRALNIDLHTNLRMASILCVHLSVLSLTMVIVNETAESDMAFIIGFIAGAFIYAQIIKPGSLLRSWIDIQIRTARNRLDDMDNDLDAEESHKRKQNQAEGE